MVDTGDVRNKDYNSDKDIPKEGPELTKYLSDRNPSYTPEPDRRQVELAFLRENLGINAIMERLSNLERNTEIDSVPSPDDVAVVSGQAMVTEPGHGVNVSTNRELHRVGDEILGNQGVSGTTIAAIEALNPGSTSNEEESNEEESDDIDDLLKDDNETQEETKNTKEEEDNPPNDKKTPPVETKTTTKQSKPASNTKK